MSLFRQKLQELTQGETQAFWADRFGIDRTNYNKLLRAEVPCGHLTMARILLGLPQSKRQPLLAAYLKDEVVAISAEAAELKRRPQKLMHAPKAVKAAAKEGGRLLAQPPLPLDGLPSDLTVQLERVVKRAQKEPAVAEKLIAALQLVA